MKLFLIHLLLLVLMVNSQACQNNGTYIQDLNVCICPEGFIGQSCVVAAYQLSQKFTKVMVDSNFTFAYFSPEQKVVYKFVLTFCAQNSSLPLQLFIYAQQEKKNGEVQLQPKNKRDLTNITIKDGCEKIYSTTLVSRDKKQNGQLPKIVFGFKLTGQNVLKPQQIFVQIDVEYDNISTFLENYLIIIWIFFFVLVIFLLLTYLVLMLRKRWAKRKDEEEKVQIVSQNLRENTQTRSRLLK